MSDTYFHVGLSTKRRTINILNFATQVFQLISLHKNNKDICKTWWRRSQKFSWILNKLNESLHCYEKILTYFRNWVSIHFFFKYQNHFLLGDSRKYPYPPTPPPHRMVLPIRPHTPLGISVPEGSCITPPPSPTHKPQDHTPGFSYFPFHGVKFALFKDNRPCTA